MSKDAAPGAVIVAAADSSNLGPYLISLLSLMPLERTQ